MDTSDCLPAKKPGEHVAEITSGGPLRDLEELDVREWCDGLGTYLFGPGGYESFADEATREFKKNVAQYHAVSPKGSKTTSDTAQQNRSPLRKRRPVVTLATLAGKPEKDSPPSEPRKYRAKIVKRNPRTSESGVTPDPGPSTMPGPHDLDPTRSSPPPYTVSLLNHMLADLGRTEGNS